MEGKETDKTPKVVSKSLLAVGPTLHYSHANVQRCWFLAVVAYCLTCLFWSRMVTGVSWSFDWEVVGSAEFWRLDHSTMAGLSIFEYPWQILVLGMLVGVLAGVPVLISQLMSFGYSIVFILAVLFLANLPGLAVSLLLSCFAVACRPLRFRSRIIAVALCTAPQLLYLGFFGAARGVEPIKWGFSFAPWVCAWFVGAVIAGLVLGIGHYTRYRPGLVWIVTTLMLLIVVVLFEAKVGLDELDYQLYVAKNNPERVSEFRDRSITEALDQTIADPAVRKYLAGFFYPTEPTLLREELKREIQAQLGSGFWPYWFIVPRELRFQQKKQQLNRQYELFIDPPKPWWMPTFLHDQLSRSRAASKRMAVALYYKALLGEYWPDMRLLEEEEILHFRSDYPHERPGGIWWVLYRDFGDSPESLEARWRIAVHWIGKGMFEQADDLLAEAQVMLAEHLEQSQPAAAGQVRDTLFSPFQPPADSVMTPLKLIELRRRLNELRNLISSENRTEKAESTKRLSRFVMLNPYSLDYEANLDALLAEMDERDPLRDNVLLEKAKVVADEQLRAERLSRLHEESQDTDGGMQALYELGLLRISLWRQGDESEQEYKNKLLVETRQTLTKFLTLYADSIYSEQVKRNLADLPTVE